MDELSRDLMSGIGGLEALNGGLDGNLTQWAEGEAIRQTADQPTYRLTDRSASTRASVPFGAVLVAALIVAVLILLLLAAL